MALGLLATACDSNPSSSGTTATAATAAASVPATTALATTTSTAEGTDVMTTSPTTAGPTTTPSSTLPAPSGDAFYQPPDPIPGTNNGDLIWATELPGAVSGATSWQVLYRSENLQGEPIAVSGIVVAPTGAAPGNPVLTWAHGTTGIADQCAISKQFSAGLSAEKLVGSVAVGEGWTFVATDYEGLGTPGVHPYLVGLSEARGVLDIVRAAQQLPTTGVTTDSPVMIFGHSQGGGAALFAAEQAATWAPELDVVGTVAGAPAGDLDTIVPAAWSDTVIANPFAGSVIDGFKAGYPDLSLDAVANADGQAALAQVATECVGSISITPEQAGARNPMDDPAWKAAIDANTAGSVVPSAPVLIVHGEADTTVPRALTDITLGRYCAIGATVEVKSYPGQDHTSVITAALTDIKDFFHARLDGQPATSSC
ncbi:MAG: alpha/beta fold hydrolase [Ilumatobacteraceae bacterium]